MLLAPAAAVTAVAAGLRLGAARDTRAAVVYGAPRAAAGTGLAWQVVTFDEEHGVREPVALPRVEVTARERGAEARWSGATNQDGTAEVALALPPAGDVDLEVRAGGVVLARGAVAAPSEGGRAEPAPAWARFSRRQGAVSLDVAVLGQRGASGFPSSVWARATDAATGTALPGVHVEMEGDSSLSVSRADPVTDGSGWAHLLATPMGYAVTMRMHARAPDGRTGDWTGALWISPGAAHLAMRDRYSPEERPEVRLVAPNMRPTAYLEVDDGRGRAWASPVALQGQGSPRLEATVSLPALAPGLYWAIAASDPTGAARLGPGTIVRPFFVARDDAAALAFGLDPAACAPRPNRRDDARAVAVCLALAAASPIPRWTALDGLASRRAHDARLRAEGLAVALTAVLAAALLEALLLVRTAWRARAALRARLTSDDETAVLPAAAARVAVAARVGVAVLVAVLGFALLAAFLVRVG